MAICVTGGSSGLGTCCSFWLRPIAILGAPASASAHYCLGAPLARIAAQIAIRLAFDRLPGRSLASTDLRWQPTRSGE